MNGNGRPHKSSTTGAMGVVVGNGSERTPTAWLEVDNQVINDDPGMTRAGSAPASEHLMAGQHESDSMSSMRRIATWKNLRTRTGVQGYDPEERAQHTISTAWQNYRYRDFMSKHNLSDRLELEDAVGKGVVRLAIYSLMFLFIVFALEVGVPDSMKLDAKKLITDELSLASLYEIKTLQGLRDHLPVLSDGFKRFSSSSNMRFTTEDGFIVKQKRVELVRSKTLFSFNPEVTGGAFTLASWVERLSGSKTTGRISLLRKPMKSDRELSCWGWFLDATTGAPQLRFGAHDFHSLDDRVTAVEEVVEMAGSNEVLGEDVLSHEVLVVDGLSVSFYRDGERLGETQLMTRPLTDCINPDSTELGDERLAMSAVKFYTRALSDTDVQEMFQGGAPLVEVATGSKLAVVAEDELLQVGVEVTDGKLEVLNAVDYSSEVNMVSSKVGLSASDNNLAHFSLDPNFPEDPSPPAVLPRGNEAKVVAMLPSYELELWEAANRPTTGFQVEEWVRDSVLDETYFSLVDTPVHGDGTPAGRMPFLDGSAPDMAGSAAGLALSFWFKSYQLSRGHGPNVEIKREAQDGLPAMTMELQLELDWVWVSLEVDGVYGYVWSFLTVFDEETGRIKEDFLLYSFAQNPAPLVWRHLLLQYNGTSAKFEFYLDGEQVLDAAHYQLVKYTGWDDVPGDGSWTPHHVFSNATVTPHSWAGSSSWQTIPGKIAQMRAYPRMLTQEEIRLVHEGARWPSQEGSEAKEVRQCSNPKEDFDYSDTVEVDGKGHSCAWFATVEKHSPYICAQTWAKNMCPVTCAGKRLCHDGSLLQSRQAPVPRRKFRVFDRIMHIKPSKPDSAGGSESVICPSDRVSREQVLQECEAWKRLDEEEAARTGGAGLYSGQFSANFTRLYARTFSKTNPADVRDCQILAERMDEDQCQWNASWMDDFQQDYEETGTWSVSFWLKPKDGSLGMPNNFWFAVNLFSTLAPPLLLSHWNEIQPTLEPWMDAYTAVADENGKMIRERASVFPTTLIDYAGSWTFFHMQLEKLEGDEGKQRLCATLNAIPLSCSEFVGKSAFPAGRFLEGIEFTTEMLVSPIEVTTERLSPSELQKKYYRRVIEMGKIFGPKAQKSAVKTKVSEAFDNKLVLMAPPVVFQTRRQASQCSAELTAPIVTAQLELLEAAHCTQAICTNVNRDKLVTCQGDVDSGSYFGRNLSTLGGRHGHADFLYTIADNPVLVRNGTLLEAERFIDTLTSTASIVAVFQDPSTGLISQLVLESTLTGKTVTTEGLFSHLGFVAKDELDWLMYNYGMLCALVLCAVLANLHFLYDLYRHAKKTEEHINVKGVMEVVYDLVMATLAAVFGIVALLYALNTEHKALDFVHRIANIPFARVPFGVKVSRFFESIDVLNEDLAEANLLSACAFALMVLMLIRIVHATGVHPRLKVLVGTLYVWPFSLHAMTDLWHFALLMVVIFFFFSFTAKWMFSKDREDFRDLRASMKTQFEVLMGRTPKDFENETRLTVFICFTIVVQFFLMRHFLLAIIMQGYLKLRREVEENEAERGFIEDVMWTLEGWVRSKIGRWPSRQRVHYILRKKIGSKAISFTHLRLAMQDVDPQRLLGFWNYYLRMHWLQCPKPPHMLPPSNYQLQSHEEIVQSNLHEMQRRLSRLEAEKNVNGPKRTSANGAADQKWLDNLLGQRRRSLPSDGPLVQSAGEPEPREAFRVASMSMHRTPKAANGTKLSPAPALITPVDADFSTLGVPLSAVKLQDGSSRPDDQGLGREAGSAVGRAASVRGPARTSSSGDNGAPRSQVWDGKSKGKPAARPKSMSLLTDSQKRMMHGSSLHG